MYTYILWECLKIGMLYIYIYIICMRIYIYIYGIHLFIGYIIDVFLP